MTPRRNNYRQYVGMEDGLKWANVNSISVDKDDMERKRKQVSMIVRFLIKLMRAESSTFNSLYVDVFGAGSGFEGLKISEPDEFDFDILMRIPGVARPVLLENNIPGYVNLQLEDFEKLKSKNLGLYKEMQFFVDEKNYLLTKEWKGSFMQSIFDRVMNGVADNVILIGTSQFKITRVQNKGPAFTLTIDGPNDFHVSVDMVPCILLDKSQWPGEAFRPNPYNSPSDSFIVPKSPKKDIPHIERYWRLSFQKQERIIIFDRQWLKPTIRVLKKIRDHFDQDVSSYAIKTMFFHQLKTDNPTLDRTNPELWLAPLSYCVVYMLQVYSDYLYKGEVPYFWNKKLNLLENQTDQQLDQYKNQIDKIIEEIKLNPVPATILKYLS